MEHAVLPKPLGPSSWLGEEHRCREELPGSGKQRGSGGASLGIEKPFPHQSLGFPPPLNFLSFSIIFNCIFSVKTLLRIFLIKQRRDILKLFGANVVSISHLEKKLKGFLCIDH